MDRLQKALSWVTRELDALVALALGITFAVLGLLNVVEGDALTEATLALLAVLALAIVRERTSRQSFVTGATRVQETVAKIQESIAKIEESVSSLRTGMPYRVLMHEVAWELLTADGSFAVARKLMRLRFLQNNVISLYDYSRPGGRVSNARYSPGKKVDTFIMGSRRYDLISLGRSCKLAMRSTSLLSGKFITHSAQRRRTSP
jgi:hypothetical protein